MNGAVAVLFTADALLVGRTIDVTGDIFYEKKEKTYYIDTFMAEGAIPDRWEAVSVVTTKRNEVTGVAEGQGTDHATVLSRAQRKAVYVKTAGAAAAAAASLQAEDLVAAVRAVMANDVKPTALKTTE